MKVTRRDSVRKPARGSARSSAPSKAKSKRVGRASPPLCDITEHKRMEDRMLEPEEKFNTLLEYATDGILIADVNSKKLVLGNKAISQMLAYRQEEIKNLTVMDLATEKDLPHMLDVIEKACDKPTV